ncbi:hypothetical protein E2562_014457 [Oryza meyeriana var. granulata]|uniref:C3H1-type domain-containing protein n=1 Tax=Oryza meyeriana var. granulata TaxID=110450 RepID=A0A6G1CP21_9ORYZ|nr:hypothetical protein E2562_014457 [Oryza meyeriana var. granulata]
MESELSFLSPLPARSSCFSFEDSGSGSPAWAATVEALLSSPTSSVSDGRGGGGYSSPTRASPLEKLLDSPSSCVSDCRDAGDFSSPTWASPLEKPLTSPSSCISDGRGGGFSSPTWAFPTEKLLISPPSCVSSGRGIGNAGGFSSLPWASPLEKPLKSPSSCVSDGRSGGYSSPLGASAERERQAREAERLLRSIAERYDDCFLRLREATAELADLRRERLRLGAENLHLSLLEDLESEQRKQASAVAPPKPAEEEATQGGAPKSISIRSPSYLSQKQPQGQAKPQLLRVRASQATKGAVKTELCNKWERGALCPYGARCRFAHGLQELRPVIRHPRYKTLPCQMFAAASGCPYGHRCHFRHSPLPATAESN